MDNNLKKYKPKHFNRASINFLYEVSAIPIAIRKEYLENLLKRKNAGSQKNVRLIRLIYHYIDSDTISSWDPDEICRKLDVSYNMLRYHKSRLLKQLREYYFKWKEFSKELESSIDKTDVFTKDFIRAKKMYEIGMRKEAKTILLRLLRKKKDIRSNEEIFVNSEIYELLLDYYFRQRDRLKFNIYLREFSNFIKPFIEKSNDGFTMKEISLMKARLYISLGKQQRFYLVNDKPLRLSISNYSLALKEAKTSGSIYHILFLLLEIGLLERMLGETKKALRLFEEGNRIAEKHNFLPALYSFKSMLAYERSVKDKRTEYLTTIEECYVSLGRIAPHSHWFRTVSFNYYNILVYFDNEKIPQIKMELVNYLFLYPSHYRALLELYNYKFGTSNLFEWGQLTSENGNSTTLGIRKINYDNCSKLEDLIIQLITHFNKFDRISSKLNILEDYLFIEFLKGKNCNYANTELLINRIEWIINSRHINLDHSDFYLIKMSLKMMDEFQYMNKMEFLEKFQKNFEDLTLKALNSCDMSLLSYYSIACYTARQIGYKEITAISDNLYHLIEKNHPEILAPVLRELEEKNTKVYTVVGKEQSAA